MNFSGLLDSTFYFHLTLTLAHFLWQGVVIAVFAILTSLCLRKASARSRYLVPETEITPEVELAEPAVAVIQPPVDLIEPVAGSFEPPADVVEAPLAPRPIETEPVVPEQEAVAAIQPDTSIWRTLAPCVSGVYAVGVLVMLARLWLALHGGYRLRRRSRPVDDPGLLAIIQQ